MDLLDLRTREGLPDALRVLLDEFPRSGWQEPGPFRDMIVFWLQRHLGFRDLIARLDAGAATALDGADPRAYRQSLAQMGGLFLNELHTHHTVEDTHYFPVLERTDALFARGLRILDADHHAISAILEEFTTRANAVLREPGDGAAYRDSVGALHELMTGSGGLIARHFEDEEELVVPVILKNEPDALRY